MRTIRTIRQCFRAVASYLGDAGRHHADGHADEHPSQTGHLLRPSSPTSPVGLQGVRTSVRPGACQAVIGCHSGPQRLANRARRKGLVCAALARATPSRRRRLDGELRSA